MLKKIVVAIFAISSMSYFTVAQSQSVCDAISGGDAATTAAVMDQALQESFATGEEKAQALASMAAEAAAGGCTAEFTAVLAASTEVASLNLSINSQGALLNSRGAIIPTQGGATVIGPIGSPSALITSQGAVVSPN